MSQQILRHVEQSSLKPEPPQFDVGDTVDVHTRIVEGEKQRIQVFSGTVIIKTGGGISSMFTVRRIVNGEGVERIFPVHSPAVDKVEVRRGGKTRRAKLTFLRERTGKSTRLVEKKKDVGYATADKKGAKARAKRNKTATPELAAAS